MAGTKYIVTSKSAAIREKPDINCKESNVLYKDQIITCTTSKDLFYYVPSYKGYILKGTVKKYTGSSEKSVTTNFE